MFNPFGNKKKEEQEALEKKQKKYEEGVEMFLSTLHPSVRDAFAKDVDAFESYIEKRDHTVPIGILILMSQAEIILDRLKILEGDLASTVEVDSPETGPTESV